MVDSFPRAASAHLHRFLSEHTDAVADASFIVQLSSQFHGLYRLFFALYGTRPDGTVYFDRLLILLLDRWRERPDVLKASDRERADRGAWWQDGTVTAMQLYVDRFSGSLSALAEDLEYFTNLGVNALHLMPIMASPKDHNDGGYAVSDYLAVQPQFGSMDDLQSLAADMHARDMVLVLDYVLNHTSDEHEWAQRALAGETQYQDYYFMFPDRTVPDLYERHLPEVFPETAPGNFTYRSEIDRWIMTVFHSYQWDLNYANPAVFLEMAGILLTLANHGVDIVRLDAVPYLWKQLGTAGQNLPAAHTLVRLLNACARIAAPGIAFIAEAIVQPEEIARYFGEGEWAGHECELAYNASLMVLLWDALATGKAELLRHGLSALPQPPRDASWLNYVRCHDDIGLGYDEDHLRQLGWDPAAHRAFIVSWYTGEFAGSPARGARFMYNPRTGDARISGTAASLAGLEAALEANDGAAAEEALQRMVLLYATMLALPGVPVIYAGDEIAATNDYSYADDPRTARDNRWMHRPHLPRALRRQAIRGTGPGAQMYGKLKGLLSVRAQNPVLRGTAPVQTIPCSDPHLLMFVRANDTGERILFVGNFGREACTVPQAAMHAAGFGGSVIDIAHGRSRSFHPDGISLEPNEFLWLSPGAMH